MRRLNGAIEDESATLENHVAPVPNIVPDKIDRDLGVVLTRRVARSVVRWEYKRQGLGG